jgi:hypothetical protein
MSEDQKHIEQLLQKYLESQTSLEEESQLHHFFSRAEQRLDPKVYWARDLFNYSSSEKQQHVDFEISPILKQSRSFVFYRMAAAIAALVVTSLGVYRLEENYQERKMQEAYAETRKAFMLIAEQLQVAQEQTVYLDYIDQSMNKLLK